MQSGAYVKARGKCLPRSKTEFQSMSETNVGANLMFALRTTTINEPMTETNSFVSEHRFDSGCSSEGEHKVRPYIGFGQWLDSGSCE
jgi:hypothetical protein